jgi:hypothetical protein
MSTVRESSSHPTRPVVNAAPLRRFIVRLERRLKSYRPRPKEPRAADPVVTEERVREALDALAARYQPGEALSRDEVATTCGITGGAAGRLRLYCKCRGRWPYRDRGAYGRPMKGGRSSS